MSGRSAVALVLCAAACGSPQPDVEHTANVTAAEQWDYDNDPFTMDPTFDAVAVHLPLRGNTKAPLFPGWYWAAWQDSINYRWDGDGSLSPAEKYERLTGRENVSWAVSSSEGVLSYTGATGNTTCSSDADCSSQGAGTRCGMRLGATTGYCIATWHGICDGFAAFAIREPRAKSSVTRDGVTFYPADLDALMSILYADAIDYSLLAGRCNDPSPARDGTGRIIDPSCRNVNPGALHVALANQVGARGESLILDESPSVEVWNLPVSSYQVTNTSAEGLQEVSRAQALALLGVNTSYLSIAAGLSVDLGRTEGGSYTVGKRGSYVLRGDGKDVFVLHAALSGQEVCRSQTSGPAQQCLLSLEAGDVVEWSVEAANAAASDVNVGLVSEGPDDVPYLYNPAAARLFYVNLDVVLTGFVAPSRAAPTTQAPLLDAHYHEYQYILEVDEGGRILGGEWAGGSKVDHPAFAWVPAGAPGATAEGKLSYPDVKSLNDEAAGLRRNYASHLVNPRVLSMRSVPGAPVVEVPGGTGSL